MYPELLRTSAAYMEWRNSQISTLLVLAGVNHQKSKARNVIVSTEKGEFSEEPNTLTWLSPAAFMCVSELIHTNLTAYWFGQSTLFFEFKTRETAAQLLDSIIIHLLHQLL